MNTGRYGARAGGYNQGKLPPGVNMNIGRAGTPMPLGAAQRAAAHQDQIINVWGGPMRERHSGDAGAAPPSPASGDDRSRNSLSSSNNSLSRGRNAGGAAVAVPARVTDEYVDGQRRFSNSLAARNAPSGREPPTVAPEGYFSGQFDSDLESDDGEEDQDSPPVKKMSSRVAGAAPASANATANAANAKKGASNAQAAPQRKKERHSSGQAKSGFCCFG
mmetsp:Transcript_46300/g.113602  ORF Transcript_46300/g.113602 Transcript_46300/m.113602 type:complete len:219 (+) Transcript_46300:129-785(+)|eukprot:CAMPEP_0198308066 /NCGR_PEP_ID=MMETSP1450-20131203/846_1 /TAXON_ID=753684 ORGANISM="Madagascaria erythrocladiodes, Strain CCMP3234" /NCGR_SAMPLE_ID=MMETSP1450 /ASSEMBLY_ACC=CAM_ASM_001115 /LENGTH=218 /DNA_ID=CAMNT_0044010699 /DNA_START=83 /DNA_END=739 /DNA_ORIENTATION=+